MELFTEQSTKGHSDISYTRDYIHKSLYSPRKAHAKYISNSDPLNTFSIPCTPTTSMIPVSALAKYKWPWLQKTKLSQSQSSILQCLSLDTTPESPCLEGHIHGDLE